MTRPLTSPLLHGTNIRHGFFTRKGGHSSGLYTSLNCGPGSDDRLQDVAKNRQAVLSAFGSEATHLCGLYQIHSNIVHYLEAPWQVDSQPKGDAIVTRQKDIVLGILTADCAPVLLADVENGVIGAAHAGWKGVLTGILENTIHMMCQQGAEISNITATVGPCIAQENYEVGAAFLKHFTDQQPDHQNFFRDSPNNNHYLFDLKGYSLSRLAKAGLDNITSLSHDTYADEEAFFSYRRATHRHEKKYGRQISAIMLL